MGIGRRGKVKGVGRDGKREREGRRRGDRRQEGMELEGERRKGRKRTERKGGREVKGCAVLKIR